jgi:hypothetical protein
VSDVKTTRLHQATKSETTLTRYDAKRRGLRGHAYTDERPEGDDEEAVEKYLNVELVMNLGTNDERRGRVG